MIAVLFSCCVAGPLGAPLSSASAQDDAAMARARDLFTRGVAAYEAGRLDEAADLLSQADAIIPSAALAYNLGRVNERMGRVDDAVRYYRRYLRDAAPDDAERAAVEGRISALAELERRHRDAVMTLPPSTDEMTAEAQRFFERGVAMFRRRRYDAALAAFTAAYRFAPLPEVIYNLAVASERTEHLGDAVDYYREYLRARPDDPDRANIERTIRDLTARSRGH
jgi:tetratricopeptide (TPR) repeat protein